MHIHYLIYRIASGKYFYTIDLKSGYWHVGLTDQIKERSAFVCRKGLFQWKEMPFGLCSAPTTFERHGNHTKWTSV